MFHKFMKKLFNPLSHIISDSLGNIIARLFSRKLKRELLGEFTDKFLETLLRGMDLAFSLSKKYRANISNFNGKYLFKTADGGVKTSAVFENSDMKVYDDAIDDWDIVIIFKNPEALWRFIFSKDQDILDSILKNEVEVDGNLNYIYKFGFMARDLGHRLGIS